MKLVLRIFNLILMTLALVAGVFLFVTPAFSFNSKVSLDIPGFAQFVPDNEFTHDLDFVELLGTDEINVGVKFSVGLDGVTKIMNGDREIINKEILETNVDNIVDTLHEPVDLITELAIRSFLKSVIQNEITIAVDEARKKYDPDGVGSTTEEIMNEVGMDDAYFDQLTYTLYCAANEEGATTDTAGETLYHEIDNALARAEESGGIDTSSFTEAKKEDLKTYFVSVLTDMNLIEDDGVTIRPIGKISYIYMIDFLQDKLSADVSATELARQPGESLKDHSNRLLNMFILLHMPEAFYTTVGYVSLGLFVGLFVIAGVWALLFVITLLRTFTKKPWTIFGFWFWPIGSLQVLMGVGITFFGKVVLKNMQDKILAQIPMELPIKSVILAPRSYALIPSIIFLVVAVLSIIYRIFKAVVKHQVKEAEYEEEYEDDEEDDNNE